MPTNQEWNDEKISKHIQEFARYAGAYGRAESDRLGAAAIIAAYAAMEQKVRALVRAAVAEARREEQTRPCWACGNSPMTARGKPDA